MDYKAALLERFLRYVAIPTQSDATVKTVPSNPREFDLARLLAEELRGLGLTQVEVSEHAVVYGKFPSNLPTGAAVPAVGWCVHMDTVNVGLSPEIHPQVVKNYAGGDICLNKEKDIWLRVAAHPEIERYKGDDIVVSDGTSVLGADDKSALANVMTALSILVEEKRPHGDIYVAFVPDEEIGLKGAHYVDLTKFPVDFAYTIDCCELGELVWETFNAGNAVLTVQGVPAHPMSAKGVLVNPILVVHDFIGMLDRGQTPECTELREGYIWAKSISANPSKATLLLNIRDHSKKLYEEKKDLLRAAVNFLAQRYPRAQIEITFEDSYANIADAVTEQNRIGIDLLYRAFAQVGVTAKTIAMRGGTDGSYLSAQGLLTANYFTGGLNFHSNCEFLPLSAWEKSLEVTLQLVALCAQVKKGEKTVAAR